MRILLTGGSGLLGQALQALHHDIAAPPRAQLDVRSPAQVREALAAHRPDIILHAAAATDNRAIESDPREALETNIVGTANLASACVGSRIRLVYLSTDYVYPGDAGDYAEGDALLPGNLYAWTKLAGEAAVRAVPNHLIIRTSFGPTRFEYRVAFVDKFSSKGYVDVIAPQVLEAAMSPLTGVLNIGGPRRTLLEYARERNAQIAPMRRSESAHDTPADTSLNLDRWHRYLAGKDVLRGVTACRVCEGQRLTPYLDLGMMPLANNLAESAVEARRMSRFPMQVLFCEDCALSQLSVVVDPRAMFSHYTYRSSVNQGYRRHCREMARTVGPALGLGSESLVVDVAGNDGALLHEFREELSYKVLNIDPAANIAEVSLQRGIPTINDFWSADVAGRVVEQFGRPQLITATNVFAHVDDVRAFVGAARECLAADGALMLEFPYCVDFIDNAEFDTIYFEHLSYVLLAPVCKLAGSLDMEVFEVSRQDIHGGTVRVFIGNEGRHAVQPSVAALLQLEAGEGFHAAGKYHTWAANVDALIADLRAELGTLRASGASVAAFAASAKGNTLLNACGFDQGTIEYIVDDTPEKIGRFSPGNGIPIVDRAVLAANPPDYLLILAWNFSREIMESVGEFGGKFVLPIPRFRIVD